MRRPIARAVLLGGLILTQGAVQAGASMSFIYEYPHARVALHAHPRQGQNMSIDLVRGALAKGVHEQELDLHLRGNDVVCDHDSAQASSPTLKSVLDLIVARRGARATVQNDGRQFIVVLEPKDDDTRLLQAVHDLLVPYKAQLSTAVDKKGGPRGITFLFTGDQAGRMYSLFGAQDLNTLALVEGHNYAAEITNLAPGSPPFMWGKALHVDGEVKGAINELHKTGFSARVYYDTNHSQDDVNLGLASGADTLNCDFDEITFCQQLLRSQQPRGHWPTLAMRGGKALLSWRGASSNSVYVALGTSTDHGLVFARQINMTYLLRDKPLGLAPFATLAPDGRLVEVYEGTDAHRLWSFSGRLTSLDRFVTFDGSEHKLTLANDAGRRGETPTVAFAPGGQMLMAYDGTSPPDLWYLTGTLGADGTYTAVEHRITRGDGSRRGYAPAMAIDARGRVILVYQGTDNQRLFYIGGRIDGSGNLPNTEFRLTDSHENRRGTTPSVAIRGDGSVVIAYEGTGDQKIWFTYGTLASDGSIAIKQESLLVDTAGTVVHGSHPTAAFDDAGRLTILYEGTNSAKLFYVSGPLDWNSGRVLGVERLLDMDLGDGL